MAYLDTNVLLSYYFENDGNHQRTVRIVESLKLRGEKAYVSPLTIAELYSVVSRALDKLRLPPCFASLDRERQIHALIKDIIKRVGVVVVNDEPRLDQVNEGKAFHIYARAAEQAGQLKLKTLDLLHIAYALWLAERKSVHTLITFDKEITGDRCLSN